MVNLAQRFRQARAHVERHIARLGARGAQQRAQRVEARLRSEGVLVPDEQLPAFLREQVD